MYGNFNVIRQSMNEKSLINTVTQQGNTTCLTFGTNSQSGEKEIVGSFSSSVTGGVHSWIAADFATFLELEKHYWFWGKQFGKVYESVMNNFRLEGKIPTSDNSVSPYDFLQLADSSIRSLSEASVNDRIKELMQHPSFNSVISRVKEVNPELVKTLQGKTNNYFGLKTANLKEYNYETRTCRRIG